MPIFTKNNKRILFIHVPKSGGTSIEHFLKNNGFKMDFYDGGGEDSWNSYLKCSPQHMSASIINEIFRLNAFDAIFMIVRNPLERMLSEYKWRRKHSFLNEKITYNDFINLALNKYKENNYAFDNHIRPQVQFQVSGVKIFKLESQLEMIPLWLEETLKITFKNKEISAYMKSTSVKNEEINLKLSDLNKQKLFSFYKEDFIKYNYNLGK